MQAEPDLSLVQEEPWVGVIILSRRSVSDHVRASFWIHQRNALTEKAWEDAVQALGLD